MITLDVSKEYTIGEKYKPAMKIRTKKAAIEYLAELVKYNITKTGNDFDTAIKIEKNNLGYFSGYYDNVTIKRVQKLFECSHPVLG